MHNLVCNELENGGPLHVVGEKSMVRTRPLKDDDDEFSTRPYLVSEEYPDDANEEVFE